MAGQRSAALTLPADARGPHQVLVTLRTHEANPREFRQRLDLHYQPPPPAAAFDPAWLRKQFGDPLPARLVVRDQPKLTVEAAVHPGTPGEKVLARMRRGDDPFDDVADPEHIKKEITLKPGDNTIELVAVNQGALKGHEELETTRQTLSVYYVRPAAPPGIVLKSVTAKTTGAQPLPVVPGQPLIVSAAEVRIQGEIAAEENLQEAQRDDRAVAGFRPGTGKQTILDETVTLRPGRQVVRFTARTATSPATRVNLTLDYRPPLPRLVLTAPADGEAVFSDELVVRGRLTPPEGKVQPFKAAVTVDGREQDAAPTLADDKRALEARIHLKPGANRIEVRLSNEWGESARVVRPVNYQRPPRIVSVEEPALGRRPFIDLAAQVESPADLPPERVEVNSRTWPANAVRVEKAAGREGQWRVVAAQVPLELGENVLRLAVANKDGPCREPVSRHHPLGPSRPAGPRPGGDRGPEDQRERGHSGLSRQLRRSFRQSPARVQLRRGQEVLFTADLSGQRPTTPACAMSRRASRSS